MQVKTKQEIANVFATVQAVNLQKAVGTYYGYALEVENAGPGSDESGVLVFIPAVELADVVADEDAGLLATDYGS